MTAEQEAQRLAELFFVEIDELISDKAGVKCAIIHVKEMINFCDCSILAGAKQKYEQILKCLDEML